MAPSNLQGLNVVHRVPNRDHSSDSQDLLDFPAYRDFGAQLDLWTNLNFESDEPFLHKGDTRSDRSKPQNNDDAEDDDEAAAKESDLLYPGDAHENIVTGIPLPIRTTSASSVPAQSSAKSTTTPGEPQQPGLPSSFDLTTFFTTFGIDPFGLQAQQLQQSSLNIPTLAQLLTVPNVSGTQASFTAPVAAATIAKQAANKSQLEQSQHTSSESKRIRTTKLPPNDASPSPEAEYFADPNMPVTPAEDKRRRNTAASARFRLKKKEREAALEKKAKELEIKVNELEKECEGLRRENGWLKGLVVGVTGGVAQQAQSVEVKAGAKRGREDDGGFGS